MCFYDQYVYQCGDFKWGPARERCTREYRTGEVCGMKLVLESLAVDEKCRICQSLDAKHRRKAREQERIDRWKRDNGKGRKASIDASEEIMKDLDRDIAKLMKERCDMQMKLN